MNKFILAAIIVLLAVAAVLYFKSPAATLTGSAAANQSSDTTASINKDLGSTDVGNPDVDLDSLGTDINSL